MKLREGLERLAALEGDKHYVLCNRIGGEDITYNIKDQTFSREDDHLMTEEEVDNDKCDTWHIYQIDSINEIQFRKPIPDEM